MRHQAFIAIALALASAEEEAPPVEETLADKIAIPTTVDGAFFFEGFGDDWASTWKVSKDADFSGTWKHEEYDMSKSADKGLVVGDAARKHAVSTLFSSPYDPKGKGLVIQYELQLKNGLQCGGACARTRAACCTCRRAPA